MNFEDLHNELNSFPEDLKYSEENWNAALEGIIAHENQKKRSAVVFGGAALAVLIALVYFALQRAPESIAQYEPRMETEALSWTEPDKVEVEELELNTQKVKTDVIKSQSSQEYKKEFVKSLDKLKKNEPAKNLAKVDSERINSEESSPIAPENKLAPKQAQEQEPITYEDTKTTDQTSPQGEPEAKIEVPEIGEKPTLAKESILAIEEKAQLEEIKQGNVALQLKETLAPLRIGRLNQRNSYLAVNVKRAELSGEKLDISNSQTFQIFREFLGLKLGLNPWAEFGRSDKFGKLNPTIGLFYEKALTQKLSWNLGLDYTTIESLSLPVHSASTAYGFGFESEVTTVHTDKIHLLELPLKVQFRPAARIQISAGMGMSYLLTANNTLEQSLVTNTTNQVLSSEVEKGYITSFNQLTVFSALGANYWISPRNRLSTELQLGLSDFSKDLSFGNDHKDKNSKIQISISRVIR